MSEQTSVSKETFFTRDKVFFKTLFSMFIVVALQNLVAYSVNIVDNIMLGNYSQTCLSGAATVNQIFFIVQQVFAMAIGEAIVVIGSQYWGKGDHDAVRKIIGVGLKVAFLFGLGVCIICTFFPTRMLQIFTNDPDIIEAGVEYLRILNYSFFLFMLTQTLMSSLRCIGIVKISFGISVVSLLVNVSINYTLIYGHFGAPEMGIRGAAIGTLIARAVELIIVVIYVARKEKNLVIFQKGLFSADRQLRNDYLKIWLPIFFIQLVWAVSTPVQTAVLGHMSANAIAANSVSNTFFQYLKVIVQGMESTTAVLIGSSIGRGNIEKLKAESRTLSVIYVILGLTLCCVSLLFRGPLLSMYSLNDETMVMSNHLIIVMSIVMIFMPYQKITTAGIIRGGGDTRFPLIINIIGTWCLSMPLTFLSAYVWKLPVTLVVLLNQSDQILKSIPAFFYFRTYRWIRRLTR